MVLLLTVLAACPSGVGGDNLSDGGGSGDTDDIDDGSDVAGPTIVFEPFTDNQPSGEDVVVEAFITDEGSGVFAATLYFRNETAGSQDWSSVGFKDKGDDLWAATIRADEQQSGGMWYYLLAVDFAQNETTDPDKGGGDPYHFGYAD